MSTLRVTGWELSQVLGNGNHNLVGEEAPEKWPAGSRYQPILTKAEEQEHLSGEGDRGRETTLPAVAQHLQNRPVSLSPGFHLSLRSCCGPDLVLNIPYSSHCTF